MRLFNDKEYTACSAAVAEFMRAIESTYPEAAHREIKALQKCRDLIDPRRGES